MTMPTRFVFETRLARKGFQYSENVRYYIAYQMTLAKLGARERYTRSTLEAHGQVWAEQARDAIMLRILDVLENKDDPNNS